MASASRNALICSVDGCLAPTTVPLHLRPTYAARSAPGRFGGTVRGPGRSSGWARMASSATSSLRSVSMVASSASHSSSSRSPVVVRCSVAACSRQLGPSLVAGRGVRLNRRCTAAALSPAGAPRCCRRATYRAGGRAAGQGRRPAARRGRRGAGAAAGGRRWTSAAPVVLGGVSGGLPDLGEHRGGQGVDVESVQAALSGGFRTAAPQTPTRPTGSARARCPLGESAQEVVSSAARGPDQRACSGSPASPD